MSIARLFWWSALSASIISAPVGAGAASLEAFAGTVAGVGNGNINAGCTTYAPPSPVTFFGSPGFGLPIGGIAACGYAGGTIDIMAPPSAQSAFPATQSLNNAPEVGGSYTGSASGTPDYGILKSFATGSFTGFLSPTELAEAAGVSLWDDGLTVTSPTHGNGTNGTIVLTFTVHGSMSTAATVSEALTELAVKHNGVTFGLHNLHVLNGTSTIDGGAPPVGMTVTSSGMFGTVMFNTLQIPIVFGTPEDIQAGLIAETFQNGTNDFSATATLTRISVLDSSQNPVNDFSINSASGTNYGPGGVVIGAVPEPGGAWLVGLGVGVLAVIRRRSKS